MTVFGLFCFATTNQDILADTFIIRDHKTNTAVLVVTSHDLFVRPFQHLDKLALAAALPVHIDLAHQYPVAM